MQNSLPVGVLERLGDLKADPGQAPVSQPIPIGDVRQIFGRGRARRALAQPPQLVEDDVKAPALDLLHEVVMVPFLMPAAENRHDIGVVQPGSRPSFPLESLDVLGFHEQACGQDLERETAA
jgi:hypothetical protein